MINVTFSEGRLTKKGTLPIMMWVTIDGERKVMQLPIHCTGNLKQVLKSKKSSDVQNICNKFKNDAIEFYNSCILSNIAVNTMMVINHLRGKQINEVYTIGTMAKEFLNSMAKRVDIEITLKSYERYVVVFNRFFEVVDKQSPAKSIVNDDILNFKQYLIKQYNNQPSTLCNALKRLKTLFEWGVKNDKISKNPFLDIKTSCKAKEVTPLTEDDIKAIENLSIVNEGLDRVRDMFLFSCYTGLSFVDLSSLTKTDIQSTGDIYYIKRNRQKTAVEYIIPLSSKAMSMLVKYDYNMPVISNQKTNQYLKTIGDCAMINQPLHFHLARHTALTMMLQNGIPIEVVSKIAGHTNIRQTQHYAKVVENRVLSFANLM